MQNWQNFSEIAPECAKMCLRIKQLPVQSVSAELDCLSLKGREVRPKCNIKFLLFFYEESKKVTVFLQILSPE